MVPLVLGLLAVAAAVAGLSPRLGVPAPLALTVVGIVASYIPGVPEYRLDSEVVLQGILPPLLYVTAIRTPFVDLRRNRRPIGLLSVALVLVTAFAVAAAAMALLPGLPLAGAIALGAIVAPPDAVAATAVARRVGMPRRIVTILEGESLLNDATALVTFRTALVALAGTVTLLGAVTDFARAVVLGVGVGIALAAGVAWIRKRVSDPVLDTSLSLFTPFVAFIAAEEVHGSGVLSVVVAGLILGHTSPEIQSAVSRVTERNLWQTVQFLLEAAVFLLIGLQLRALLDSAMGSAVSGWELVVFCTGVTLTVILVRVLWMFPAVYVPRLLPGVRRQDPRPSWRVVVILGWAGMRGVVTLAAAFILLSEDTPGIEALAPYSAAMVLAAFSVVATTLLVQGATLPWLVRRLGVRGPDPAQDALQKALVLQKAVDAGQRRLDEMADASAPKELVEALRGWSERIAYASWERLGTSGSGGETPSAAFRRLRVGMLEAERQVVVRVYRSGKVAGEVLEDVMQQLDQEEAMLSAFAEDDVQGYDELLTPEGAQPCDHLRDEPLTAAPSTADECEDCVAIGERDWVSLRMCLRCGHVACCDSSPRRHASAHYQAERHPVMRSIELGEGWRWCYVDRRTG